jgi:hypothetical protein
MSAKLAAVDRISAEPATHAALLASPSARRGSSAVLLRTGRSLPPEVSLLQPDIVLPMQLVRTPARFLTPERRLMLAILEDAVWCFQRYYAATTSQGRRIRREAERWLFARDWEWTFSFERVCEALDFNPAYLRNGLRRWQEHQPAPAANRPTDEGCAAHAAGQP